jgi:GNAT superfamily N-acetyltransferase
VLAAQWGHLVFRGSVIRTSAATGLATVSRVSPGDDTSALLRAYDEQLRAHVHDRLPSSIQLEWDGPLLRMTGFGDRGMVEYHDLGGLAGEELDELIARQIRFFSERGEGFEWKLHGHDRPVDLPERLLAASFEPEELETVVIARVADLPLEPVLPDGIVIDEVTDRAGFGRIAELEEAVWGEDHSWLDDLADEREADPDGLRVFIADAGGLVVSAGWVRFPSGTEFGTLWGGATLREWRGRGIYRALVARRAAVAAERGPRYLETDASADSRSILERLGFQAVTTTTPYIWSPGNA